MVSEVATTRRERRKQEYRDRILHAAMELFEEDGCDSTTLEGICDRADVSRPTFYKYFDCKQSLVQALAERLWLNVAQQFNEETIQSVQSIEQYLGAFFDIVTSEFSKYGRLERELIRQSMTTGANDTHYIDMLSALTAMFADAYREAISRHEISTTYPVEFLAEMTMAAINNVMMQWAVDENYPIFERLEQLKDYLPKALQI